MPHATALRHHLPPQDRRHGPRRARLSQAAPASSDGDRFDDRYVELGELKGNIGNQNYTIPSSVNLDRYPAAVVWCKRFSVAFGAAPLT